MKQSNPKKLNTEVGYIKPREITEEMTESYLDYAMSVIVSRALPDVRDGLKPVQRRILYAMYEMGLRHDAKFRKSAAVIGETMAKFHPHGDAPIYEAMARMAQDFSLRYPLIDGQGNWGSVDGDEVAAARYTECRMSKIGEEMLRDIEKNTVNFTDNYDGTRKEPTVLPSPLPQLLLNGSLGIAVGMATNIPPHNLSEVSDALIYLIEHPKATTEDLFKFIKGPDFPTGGQIYNLKEIITAYSQGRGPIVIRGKAEIVETEKGRNQILITEIPFQVQKSTLIEEFASLVEEKRIEGIKDIRDESDKEGMRIVLELQREVYPQKILNRLYKWTQLQKNFNLNLLALVDGIQPKVLSLAELLNYFIIHRKEVVFRRTQYELERAKERTHILEGLAKALSQIDAVIKTIKASKDREDAQKNLIKRFKLTPIQANAILEMKLQTLARLEREKIEEELKEKLKEIKELSLILKSPQRIREVIKREILELKAKYGDERKTKVFTQKIGEISEEDLIPQEETIITLTQGGYIKRINPSAYKIQKRGGKGILGMKTLQDDIVEHFLPAMTHDSLLFFTDSGKVFRTFVYEIPEGPRVARGRGLLNFLEISSEEKVLNLLPLGKEDTASGIKYLIMVTRDGIIKKTKIGEFDNVRRSGLIAISLKKGDLLRQVQKSTGEDEVILITKKGQAIRFKEKEIREMGRQAAGIKGIRLKKGDEVIGMDIIRGTKYEVRRNEERKKHNLRNFRLQTSDFLLVVTENGFGKRTDLKEYRLQGRGGSGIRTARLTPKTGQIVSSQVLTGEEEDLIVISQKGQVIRTKINSIPILSRATQGVRIMKLEERDKVASATCI
jgi:DNA gyrase subunit A